MPFNMSKKRSPKGFSKSRIEEELSMLRPSDLEADRDEVSKALMRVAVHGTEPFREIYDGEGTSQLVNPKWVSPRFYSLPSSDNNTNDSNDKEKNLRGDWHAAHEDDLGDGSLSPASKADEEAYAIHVSWGEKSPSRNEVDKILKSKPKLKVLDNGEKGLRAEVRYEVAVELERELHSAFPGCKVEIRRTRWSLNA